MNNETIITQPYFTLNYTVYYNYIVNITLLYSERVKVYLSKLPEYAATDQRKFL